MKRVAAYCRVSTGLDGQADSLNAQKEYYEQYRESITWGTTE